MYCSVHTTWQVLDKDIDNAIMAQLFHAQQMNPEFVIFINFWTMEIQSL